MNEWFVGNKWVTESWLVDNWWLKLNSWTTNNDVHSSTNDLSVNLQKDNGDWILLNGEKIMTEHWLLMI